jgi:hypothetical protein
VLGAVTLEQENFAKFGGFTPGRAGIEAAYQALVSEFPNKSTTEFFFNERGIQVRERASFIPVSPHMPL